MQGLGPVQKFAQEVVCSDSVQGTCMQRSEEPTSERFLATMGNGWPDAITDWP